MNFIISRYIYPLKERVVLSRSMGFYLDKPRNEQEIQAIKEFWEKTYDSTAKRVATPPQIGKNLI